MKKVKQTLKVLMMSIVSLLVLTSLLLSTMLGVVNAALFKSMSKQIDFEAVPDLPWKYYIKDKDAEERGVYKEIENISQPFEISDTDGENMCYHIAIPVGAVGLYNISFTFDIEKSDGSEDFYTQDLNHAVGCEVISVGNGFDYGSDALFRIASETAIENDAGLDADVASTYMYQYKDQDKDKQLFHAYKNYQWKTVAPSRRENVELTFVVEDADTTKGYMLWIWDFYGLGTGEYILQLENVSIQKAEDVTSGETYIDFPNMSYKNMAIIPTYNASSEIETGVASEALKPTRANDTVEGHDVAGITREAGGRGTYVTQASYDGMTMQAEPLYFGFNHTTDMPVVGSSNTNKMYDYSNPVALNIPIKNVKKNTSYKVTFDFSVACQGTDTILKSGDAQSTEVSDSTYADYTSDFAKFFSNEKPTQLNFQSYFYKEEVKGFGINRTHTAQPVRGYYKMANKNYANHWLTRYNEIAKNYDDSIGTEEEDKKNAVLANIGSSLNSYTTNSTSYNNWFNAVKRTEYNGQNTLTWLTFSNTSFTFNIAGNYSHTTVQDDGTEKHIYNYYAANDTGNIDTLYWTWTIDALQPSAWFRIKMENVRIEEVVQYGSEIGSADYSGIKIGDKVVENNDDDVGDIKTNTFNNTSHKYRGANGTGQNFSDRHYSSGLAQATLQIYAPIYDCSGLNLSAASAKKIYLSGYCVVKGGVDKYVWSADNGKTWYDMCETVGDSPDDSPESANADMLKAAEQKVDSCITGVSTPSNLSGTQTGNYVDFESKDGEKGDFSGYRIYANLAGTKYENEPDLDIIFAAVPRNAPWARCEILRLTNYNDVDHYVSQIDYISSDITINSNATRTEFPNNLTVAKTVTNASDVTISDSTVPMSKLIGRKQNSDFVDTLGYEGIYFHRRKNTEFSGYENVRTLYSGIPIKTTLSLSGVVVVTGGVTEYAYSIDGGQSWTEVKDYTAGDVQKSSNLADKTSSTCTQVGEKLVYQWLTANVAGNADAYAIGKANSNGVLSASNPLPIDLSDHVGEVVDVLVAAKGAKGSYCPIAKIDNVAVYGSDGTFYTKIFDVSVGGGTITPTYFDNDGMALNMVSKNNTTSVLAKWNLGYGAPNAAEFAYTIYEPYNVDISQTRLYSQSVTDIRAGDTISINGYMACKSGVAGYRYSFDGGITWVEINRSTQHTLSNQANPKKSDTSFVDADFVNGDFYSGNGASKLEFSLTENDLKNFSNGEEKNLLVFACGNNEKYFPVLNLRVKINK